MGRWTSLLPLGLSCAVWTGCSEGSSGTAPPDDSGTGDVGRGDAGVQRDAAAADAAPGCLEGNRLVCTCAADSVGARTCVSGTYGACEGCQDVPVSNETKCVAGYYEGTASGKYRSSSGFLGLIAPFSEDNASKLAFRLQALAGDEFTYEVRDACVHVLPQDSDVDDGSARFWLSGSVDCSTGVLQGEMRGYYTGSDALSGAETRVYYRGKIAGRFDPDAAQFIDTAYAIVEPVTVLGDAPGGEGTWSAMLQPAIGDLEATTQEACLGDGYPGDEAFRDVDL